MKKTAKDNQLTNDINISKISALRLGLLRLSVEKGGHNGLEKRFTEKISGKPRVTVAKRIIDSLISNCVQIINFLLQVKQSELFSLHYVNNNMC